MSAIVGKHIRGVFFGGNWTGSNLEGQLSDISLDQANESLPGGHSILALVYHIAYFVVAIKGVLEGKPLTSKDSESFDHPELGSEAEWEDFKVWALEEAGELARLAENLPESKMDDVFVDQRYGTYGDNLLGLIEHTHYHLGQIALIKKASRKEA